MFEPEQPRTYADLDYHEQKRYKADFRATLFLLEGLAKDTYMLVNHIIEAKVIWNDIKMLMGDTRLTKYVYTRPKTNVLDSDSTDMGNSNIIPHEQYVKHNKGLVIPSGESFVPNDAYVMHENSAYVPDDSFTTTLNIYKDQVAIYEQHEKFKLTDRESKMDDQMRMLIQERNFREEKLKKELHSLQLQFNHAIHHKKIMQDSVNTLQKDFKQKELKLLNDFSRLKTLKNKLENKLYAQDKSIQTVHMMLKPKTLCDEHSEKDTVDPNPFHLKRIKRFNLPYMMRITPTGITEGERGFEQTKCCYLTEVKGKMPVIPNENVIPKVSVCNKYVINVEPIPPSQRNNRNAQQGYLNHLKDTLDTLREIVEEAKSNRTSNNSLEYACVYTKTSQELLENMIASCPKTVKKRDRYIASTHAKRNKHVTFAKPLETSPNNTSTHVKQLNEPKTNVLVIPST
nr:hypothetical protein [Tanacetum cinerariifolium]